MNINTRNLSFVNFNNEEMQWVKFNGVTVYEAWKNLIASGVPPLKLLNCKGYIPRLPIEYQEVEYIESTGTQYIDMKYAYKINDEININFMKTKNTGAIQGVFGNGNLPSYTGVSLYNLANGTLSITIGGTLGGEYCNYPTPILYNKQYKVKISGKEMYLDDILVATVPNDLKDGTQEDFSLFRRWGTNTFYGRIYNFDIKRNNEYIFNLIPCYRKSDNVIGMYDLVSGVFYTNQGTGGFTKGKDVGVFLLDYKIYGESVQKLDAFNMNNIWDGTYTTGQYYDDNGNLIELSSITMSNMMELTYKKYHVTCINNGEVFFNFRFNYFDENENWLSQIVIGVNPSNTVVQEIEVPNDAKYINFSVMNIVINAGHKIFPSSNNVPTPTAPIEVESVGERTKNLVDCSQIMVNHIITSGGVGDAYGFQNKNGCIAFVIECESNTTYTLSSKTLLRRRVAEISDGVLVKDEITLAGGNIPHTFTTGNTTNGIAVTLQVGSNPSEVITQEFVESELIQIEEGIQTSYEPYGYKIPVKASGINLFNKDDKDVQIGRIYVDGSVNKVGITDRLASGFIPVKPNTIYSQSIKHNSSYRVGFYDSDYNYIGDSVQQTYNFTTIDNTSYVRVTLPLEQLDTYMVVEGTYDGDNTPYEPYQEPITTNIYLNEPLRKVGDYADYIDFEQGKVVRKIKKAELTKATTTYTWVSKKGVYFSGVLDGKYDRNRNSLSNRNTVFITTSSEPVSMWVGATSDMVYWIGILDVLGLTTKDEFNEWLANNPTYLLYATNYDPLEETIELPNIPTLKGTTLLSIDTKIQPSNLEVVYKGKEVK